MTIQIITTSTSSNGFFATLGGEKKFAFVSISRFGVTVKSQTSPTWDRRGLGKTHVNRSEALFHYKSGEMKSLVQAAFDLIPENMKPIFSDTSK